MSTGSTFGAITTSGIDVNMQPQRFEADIPDSMTSDGAPISFHTIVTARVTDKGLPIELITVTVGKANPPDSVKNQRIETAAQQQRIQTEQQRKLAEDGRKAAEESRAAADNAYREAMHLSPEQFLQLEHIKMQATVCGPDGKATCTFIQNGATPVYNLGR